MLFHFASVLSLLRWHAYERMQLRDYYSYLRRAVAQGCALTVISNPFFVLKATSKIARICMTHPKREKAKSLKSTL